ncbi:HNH endonuclease [Streptomyces sp. ISL-96]|uniref:HNH endonuclease n=1 Tax=Streptomyces sp. ISL-96 TaxID=2819191 RepID=UPI0035AB6989
MGHDQHVRPWRLPCRGPGRAVPVHRPDLTENLLCLCPNCHVRFDGGAYVLTEDLTIVDTVKDCLGAELKRHQWHYINSDHVRHHRHHWTSRNPAPLTALPSEQQSN